MSRSSQNQRVYCPPPSLVKMFALDPEQDIDLMTGSPGKNGDDRRVQQLRQLLLSQLDLIQKQSEVIVTKDQQIKELRHEKEALHEKINVLSKEKSRKSGVAKAVVKKEIVEEVIKHEEQDEETYEEEDEIVIQDMETEEPYFTLQNELSVNDADEFDDPEVSRKSEVPGFRLKPIPPSYVMEGTENIEDETLLKRHQKPETDEKRRKRWDVQRIREQRNVARLRARYDPSEDSIYLNKNPDLSSKLMPLNVDASSKDPAISNLISLVPDPDEADEIVVQEKLPVSVFGCVLPDLGMKDFSLPWLN